jgi:hypothetical protein
MADRDFTSSSKTQGNAHVDLNFSIKLVSGSPVFVEGDKTLVAAGSYLTLADTGTGVITVTTTDKYLASVSFTATRGMATPTGNALLTLGLATQNATTKKWSITINTWTNAAGTHSAADMVDGDIVNCRWVLRNGTVLP